MRTLSFLLLLGVSGSLPAADSPQWFGPHRNGHFDDKGLLKEWPRGGPPLVWTFRELGVGYSAPAVVGDRLYILGTHGDSEHLFCLDARQGKEVWKVKVGPIFDFKGNQWGAGPRSTPSVADGMVYALGGFGELVCVKADRGEEVWRKHMARDLKGEVNPIGGSPEKIGWGYSWSPLIDGDHVIVYPGGSDGAVAALDRKTGNLVWRTKALKEQASYASPIVAEIGGVRQYLILGYAGLTGVAAKDGAVLWTWKRKNPYPDVVIPTPIYQDGQVYVSAGYTGAGCDLVKITQEDGKFSAQTTYTRPAQNRVMKNMVGGSVIVDGHAYGYSDKRGWVCQEVKSGKEIWAERGKLGPGSVIVADGRLYCYGEDDAAVVLVEPSKEEWIEKGRFTIPETTKKKQPSGRTWTPPVVANGHLFIRDQELLFCYKIQ